MIACEPAQQVGGAGALLHLHDVIMMSIEMAPLYALGTLIPALGGGEPRQPRHVLRTFGDAQRIERCLGAGLGLGAPDIADHFDEAAGLFDFYAGETKRIYGRVLVRPAGMLSRVMKEPVGPVAAFCPWNFPIGNPARKLGAAGIPVRAGMINGTIVESHAGNAVIQLARIGGWF